MSSLADKEAAITEFLNEINFKSRAGDFEIEGPIHVGEFIPECVRVNVEDVLKVNAFKERWPSFADDLTETPEQVVKIWNRTAHEYIVKVINADYDDDDDDEDPPRVAQISIGFFRPTPLTPLIDIKSETIGKLVTVRGAVVRISTIKYLISQMTFCCKFCNKKFPLAQPEGIRTNPKKCPNDDCKNKSAFDFDETAPSTTVLEYRLLRLQDKLAHTEPGSIPRIIECRLFGDIAGMCTTGDIVTITGIVKTRPSNDSNFGQNLLIQFIDVQALETNNDLDYRRGGSLNLTDRDHHAIAAIFNEPELFRFLIFSFCPSIFGHEMVKAGLLLSLFGGTDASSDAQIHKRSDINVLMIGDPGLGKSQMLKVVAQVAPRGVFVCGSGSTVAGLTVTLMREGEGFSFEAGAMVMANNGVCCIDEFDKMNSQHEALLEAMEQQSVSIAKAGIFRTFPARTSVVAAGNPVEGHYNTNKPLSQNIKIETPLLSRFDLIFVMIDKPDEKFDRKMFEHIRDLRKTAETPGTSSSAQASTSQASSIQVVPQPVDPSLPLIQRLKPRQDEKLDLLPHELLRKYIAYARMYVKPKLNEEAGKFLHDYYQNLRKSRVTAHSLPVTARQFESLIRLTEARAKCELREEITLQDAKDVVEIFEHSISNISEYNENAGPSNPSNDFVFAVPDIPPARGSSSSSKKSSTAEARTLYKMIQNYARLVQKQLFSTDEIKKFAEKAKLSTGYLDLIAKLNFEGYLIKKSARTYLLVEDH